MLAFFVLLCVSVALAADGPCDADATKFYQCLKDSRPHHDGAKPPNGQGGADKHAEFEDLMKKRSACFTDKGCKVPEKKDDDKGKEGMDKMKQCMVTSFGKIKTCVGTDHFPEPSMGGMEHHEGGPHKDGEHGEHGGHGGPGGFHVKADSKDCPAADAVNKCLDALKPPHKDGSGSDHGDKEDWAKKRVEECNKRKDAEKKCEEGLSGPCKKSLADTKAKLCTCGKTEKPNFDSCVSSDNGKQMSDMFIRHVCNEDKCEDQHGPPHKA